MANPRFFYKRDYVRLKNKDFIEENTPKFFQNSLWPVAAEYWIEDKGCRFNMTDQYKFSEWDLFTYYELEEEPLEEEKAQCVISIGGELIFAKGEPIKRYNPLIDIPDLFIKFAKIGSNPKIDKSEIMSFISNYGLLRNGLFIKDEMIIYESDGLPLTSFYLYAREAYLSIKLYEAIINIDIDKTKKTLIQILDEFPRLSIVIYEIIRPFISMSTPCQPVTTLPAQLLAIAIKKSKSEPEKFDKYLKRYLILDDRSPDFIAEQRNKKNIEYFNKFVESNKDILCLDYLMVSNPKAYFEDFIEYADRNQTINLAGEFLSWLITERIETLNVSCNFIPPNNTTNNKPEFKNIWHPESLLGCMWLSFHQKITNQRELAFRICTVCEQPIINPRKNQKFHEGCRQIHFNRIKEEARRLWKEGKPVEEIADKTERNPKRIKEWIEKWSKEDLTNGIR